MGSVSYSAHISNGKSAITSKSKLAGVAKHNLRKYKSSDYSSDNIYLLLGTADLYQDVKNVYHREFDEAVEEYNKKQKRPERRIKDYFEHVANLDQDMAV
ncbi:MAG: mobilization protein, partial [Clostridia bacterium]|nr:mobilization protein [Clostridia bacterium]